MNSQQRIDDFVRAVEARKAAGQDVEFLDMAAGLVRDLQAELNAERTTHAAHQRRVNFIECRTKVIEICDGYSTGDRRLRPDVEMEQMSEQTRHIVHWVTQAIANDVIQELRAGD